MNEMLRGSTGLPRVAVLYDLGAAWPSDIANACVGLAEPVLVIPRSEHTAAVREVLGFIGAVVEDDDPELQTILADIDGVVTFCEELLPRVTELCALLRLPGHGPDVLERLRDKANQRECLPADLSPRWAPWVDGDPVTAAEQVGYPLVLKPRRGAASADTHRVLDAVQLSTLAGELPTRDTGYILEGELIGVPTEGLGDYVSVESVVDGERIIHVQVTGKPDLLPPYREVGSYWPAQLSDDLHAAVLDATTRALQAIGVQIGVTHTELKITPDGPRIIEVNGRVGGHVNELSRRSLEVDLVRVAIELALGRHPEVRSDRPSVVSFQVSTLAPVDECTFESVDGAATVRAMPGVDSYLLFVEEGEVLPASVATRQLDFLCGHADTHADMLALIARVQDELTFHFGGVSPRSVTATELMTVSGGAVAHSPSGRG